MQREMEKEMQNMFGNLEKQLEGVRKMAAEKKRATQREGTQIMPKLKKQTTAARVETFTWVAEAVTQGIEVDPQIYEKLFDQYDADKSGSLDMNQIKKLMKEVAMSEVELCKKALTSGELEKSMEGNPMGTAMLPMVRGQVQAKQNLAEAKVKHIDEASAKDIKKQLDITGDDRVTKTEFMGRIEQTFFFEQQMSAKMQEQMGGGAQPECTQQ